MFDSHVLSFRRIVKTFTDVAVPETSSPPVLYANVPGFATQLFNGSKSQRLSSAELALGHISPAWILVILSTFSSFIRVHSAFVYHNLGLVHSPKGLAFCGTAGSSYKGSSCGCVLARQPDDWRCPTPGIQEQRYRWVPALRCRILILLGNWAR